MIQDGRQRVDDGLVLGNLAIQHAQRIGLGAALAIARTVCGATSRSFSCSSATYCGRQFASPTEFSSSLNPLEPDAPQHLDHHLDHFRIHRRRFRSDRLRADLEKLPVAALLRPLAPEHRADVVQLLDAGALVQPVLDVGAHHRRRGFRPQRQRAAVAILEGVHLLADDVGVFAHAAREQRRLFQDGRADLVVVVGAEDFARDASTLVPDALEGGRISRVPLTALIMLEFPELPTVSSRLVPVYPGGFHVVLRVLRKRSRSSSVSGRFTLAGHAHHHAVRRHFRAFRHHRAGGDHRASSDPRAIQHDRADADQALVFDGAAVQHRQMPHRDAIADVQRKQPGVAMQHRIVLNVGLVADADGVDVAARGDVGPDAGALADCHVSDHLGAGIDVSGSGNFGDTPR